VGEVLQRAQCLPQLLCLPACNAGLPLANCQALQAGELREALWQAVIFLQPQAGEAGEGCQRPVAVDVVIQRIQQL